MIRFAIVEDDKGYRDTLQEYLRTYEEEQQTVEEKFQISLFSDGAELLDNYKPVYDIILMDIEMAQMDGMSAAEEIRKTDRNTVIIFITNLSQYAIRGYAVEAMDYILKPLSYYAFSQRLDRALKRMVRRKASSLQVSTGKGKVIRLNTNNLNFVEVIGHSMIYHTSNGQITTTGTLAELEKVLDSRQFFRCNKGYLINLDKVDNIDGFMAMVGGEPVQISRARKKAFMDALNDYISEVAK